MPTVEQGPSIAEEPSSPDAGSRRLAGIVEVGSSAIRWIVEPVRALRPSSPAPPPQTTKKKRAGARSRLRLYVATIGVGVVALTCAGLLIALALAQEAPPWWRPVNKTDQAVLATAKTIEQNLTTVLSEIRPTRPGGRPGESEPWAIAVSAADANAWLNIKLAPWLKNQSERIEWPSEIGQILVHFEPGTIRVGVEVKAGEASQVLSASVQPRIGETGELWIPAGSISVGRLPLSTSWVLSSAPPSMARDKIPASLRDLPEAGSLVNAFAGKAPINQSPVFKLPDGRRVRLLGLEADDGRVVITCRTEPREDR